jgi:hypothetical protein
LAGGGASGAGATIQGVLVGSAGTASVHAVRAAAPMAVGPSGLSVQVVGTGLTTAIDASGKFTLSGVPGGDAHLRFTGSGVDSTLDIDTVQTTETISLEVSLEGSSVVLESEARASGRQQQLEGRIESLPPTTPDGSLVIAGRTVTTGDNTTFLFEDGGAATFDDLLVGERVHVKGQTGEGGALAADSIAIQNTNPDLPMPGDDQDESASIHGLLTSLSGSAPALTLLVDDTTVTTTADTVVQRKGDTQALDVLAEGMTVHVVGARQADGSIVARKIQITADAEGGPFEISGAAGGVKGTCPAITFRVNGYPIVTDATTVFTPDCSAVKSGSKVHVVGTTQADGSVLAASVDPQ